MFEDLISLTEDLIKSSKRGGVQRLNYTLNILQKEGRTLFTHEQENLQLPQSEVQEKASRGIKKKTDITQATGEQERILKIIDQFIDEFERNSLSYSVSVKNYLLFLLIVLKILRKLKVGYQRSLYAAHTLSKINQMFSKYPVNYTRRTTKDPLGLLFVVTHLVIEAGRNLKFPYKLDETVSQQFVPLVTKYCMDSENPLQEIMLDVSEMSRFRLPIIIDQNHKDVITKIFGYCISKVPVKIRVYRATKLLENIIPEKSDSAVLAYYDTLKLFFEKDDDVKTHLSKIAKEEMCKTEHRMFVKGIIEEITRLT
jgi:hypothetical protein